MMASGKTSVGGALSTLTGWPYRDNDDALVGVAGGTPRDILARSGEQALRTAEAAALADELSMPAPAIVAAAAGTILDDVSRTRIAASGVVVYLRADVATLERRSVGSGHRAWLDRDARTWIGDALAEREPLYESVADVTFDTENETAAAIAAAVVQILAGWCGLGRDATASSC